MQHQLVKSSLLLTLLLLETNLGRDVIGRPAEGLGRLVTADTLLAHTEVGDFDVAVLIQQDVVELQIPVDYSSRVKEEQPDRYFRRVESGEMQISCG